MVPADSDRVSRARPYSGTRQGRPRAFAYRAVTFCGVAFHPLRLTRDFVTPRPAGRRIETGPTTPTQKRLPPITLRRFGLIPFRSPLLRESRFLSFPPVTKMFQFTGLPLRTLCIQVGAHAHYHVWVSPFGNPGIDGRSAPPPGLSQPPTSFFGSWRQGIHRVPLVS